jgi:dTDP-4-dehydrorhamnose reductase
VPNIVIIGESGQLAQSLGRLVWPQGCTLALVGRRHVPAGNPEAIAEAAAALNPDLLLNAAAFTGVDRAESEPDAAAALNAGLPRALAGLAHRLAIPLVHVSTDYVFDGRKRAPYLETDTPNPLSVYAATKLDGDRAVEQARLRRWAILRSSWVMGEIGETFPVKILRRARQGETLRVVDDQRGCPTAAGELARAMQAIGLKLLAGDPAGMGMLNFCGASQMSWFGLTELLLQAAEGEGLKRPSLQAIKTAELNVPARRPVYSVLNCDRIAQRCGINGAPIEADIPHIVRAILAS